MSKEALRGFRNDMFLRWWAFDRYWKLRETMTHEDACKQLKAEMEEP